MENTLPKADTKPIESASDLLNTTLTSKGYISEPLRFTAIDWDYLIEDQPARSDLSNLIVGQRIFDNDKRTINILYSLTRAIDRHNEQHRALNDELATKQSKINELQSEVSSLKSRNRSLEQKLDRLVQVDQITMNEQLKSLKKINRSQNTELQRLRNWTSDIENKYEVGIRKKNIEISQIKDRLLDSRNLSSGTIGGRLLDSDSATPLIESTSHTIYNNKPIVDNAVYNEGPLNRQKVLGEEYDNIAGQLSELSENLINENSKYANFVTELNVYFDKLNDQLSLLNYKTLSNEPLVNPSQEIDLARILQVSQKDVEPFDHVSSPLLSNVYKNNHYVSALVEIALASSGSSGVDQPTDELNRLRSENKQLYDNLDDAVKALEQWQKYLPEKFRSKS